MANRSKKKKVAKKKQPPKEISNEIWHLQNLLTLTLRAMDGRSEELDAFFKNQAQKIAARINKSEGKQ
jgi:hypothetical protein